MYKPKLGCRRKAENGGHDGRGLMRCCDTGRCRWFPPEDAGAAVPGSEVHRRHPVLLLVRRLHRRINPHFHRRIHPEGDRSTNLFTKTTRD